MKKKKAKTKTIKKTTTTTVEQAYHWKDVKILRETLAKAANRMPGEWAVYFNTQLLQFANAIKENCTCPERAFVVIEKMDACLFCGKRHEPSKKGHLKSVK